MQKHSFTVLTDSESIAKQSEWVHDVDMKHLEGESFVILKTLDLANDRKAFFVERTFPHKEIHADIINCKCGYKGIGEPCEDHEVFNISGFGYKDDESEEDNFLYVSTVDNNGCFYHRNPYKSEKSDEHGYSYANTFKIRATNIDQPQRSIRDYRCPSCKEKPSIKIHHKSYYFDVDYFEFFDDSQSRNKLTLSAQFRTYTATPDSYTVFSFTPTKLKITLNLITGRMYAIAMRGKKKYFAELTQGTDIQSSLPIDLPLHLLKGEEHNKKVDKFLKRAMDIKGVKYFNHKAVESDGLNQGIMDIDSISVCALIIKYPNLQHFNGMSFAKIPIENLKPLNHCNEKKKDILTAMVGHGSKKIRKIADYSKGMFMLLVLGPHIKDVNMLINIIEEYELGEPAIDLDVNPLVSMDPFCDRNFHKHMKRIRTFFDNEKTFAKMIQRSLFDYTSRFVHLPGSYVDPEPLFHTLITETGDTVRMLREIEKEEGKLERKPFKTIRAFHNEVSNKHRKIQRKDRSFGITKQEESRISSDAFDYAFRVMRSTHELIDLSNHMSNCLSGYDQKALNKQVFVVEANNRTHGKTEFCFTVKKKGGEFILDEAKQRFNDPITKKQAQTLKKWGVKNNIKVTECHDVKHPIDEAEETTEKRAHQQNTQPRLPFIALEEDQELPF